MKKIITIVAVLATLCCACSQEEDIVPEQRTKIASYLGSTHTPTLVPQSQVGNDEQLPCYTVSGDAVYRYIAGLYGPDRPSKTEVTGKSKVTITFRSYIFTYTNITDSTYPFYSNDPLLKSAYEKLGLNSEYWIFEPVTLDMAGGNILKGLRLALLGCREGDEVEAYMTYNMAYGDTKFSVIPRQSPVAIFFKINKVE